MYTAVLSLHKENPVLYFFVLETIHAERVFDVYLGNIPLDVTLVEVKINDRPLPIAVTPEYSINRIVNTNGSHAYTLHVPFDSRVVHRMVSSPVCVCFLR